MSRTLSKMGVVAMVTFVVGVLTIDFVEARRGGGGHGRSMSRGGPAAGGSFQRSHTRPQRSSGMNRSGTGDRDMGNYGNRGGGRAKDDFGQGGRAQGDFGQGDRAQSGAQGDRYDQRQDNMSDRSDNRQDRFDQRQDNLSDRQDNRSEVYNDRKEYYNDRNEWYEDRWRRGAYISMASWGRMGCANTVIVNGITYYDCGGVRYERVYRGSSVTYVIVN